MPTAEEIKIKNIYIIINPASGVAEPVLTILNEALKESQMKWEIFVTKKAGDALDYAKEGVKKKVDAVLVYGGDGTLMEAAGGLMGSDVPLGILPGGTANVLASDLGIPRNLKEAFKLILDGPNTIRKIDVGQFNKKYFILRTSLGFEAEFVKGAKTKQKNKMGLWAYTLSAFKALNKIQLVRYDLTIDGQDYKVKGLTCIIANSGSTGMSPIALANNVDVSDGLLDVIIFKRASLGLLSYVFNIIFQRDRADKMELVKHWQGKEIKVSSMPLQIAQCDGEALGKISLHVKIIPDALKVIVPQK